VLRDAGPRLHPACSQAACQGVGRARRNDRGPQKGGDPTFINALVNGEVAPDSGRSARSGKSVGFGPKLSFNFSSAMPHCDPKRSFRMQKRIGLLWVQPVKENVLPGA
jgi:hypothetical protein